ncbi:putative membrane protein [Pedobacter cryoconitis]|uniref:Putative membrane protein n=1 Tax=Pedobacter cryoconitis TaxID=188932 RepID=A0A7W8ZQ28_9SPHI|nr:DUF1269 domain-containing protein [Pedobacter cryoconitis]MBB5637847.1 putative membrane protein [Pedobacter cryoconitis]MBB6270397.1 putative membrane protein [Pedobacter cryoconitis]
MEKIIQALFNTESEAFKAMQAIQQLDAAQDVSLGESYILSKDALGNTAIRSAKDEAEGYSAIGGGIIGGLIGLLAGPLGFLVGIGAGMVAGSVGDTVRAEGVSDYLDKVSVNIPNGKSLLIAHVWEDLEIPVNSVLEPLTADVRRINVDDEAFVPAPAKLVALREDQLSRWVDNHHQHNADRGIIDPHSKEKHDRLESRIADQKSRLEQLRKDR